MLTERSYTSYEENEWDNFAHGSCGSFLGSWRVITFRRFFGAVRFFDFSLSAGSSAHRKVGQCALLIVEFFVHAAKLIILGKDGFITTARIKGAMLLCVLWR